RVGLLTNHFCGVTQDLFALSPDGNVSACYEVFSEESAHSGEFFYGRPSDTGYDFDLPVLNKLRRQAVQHREFCSGCFAKWTCAGDCYHKSINLGATEFSGTDRCHITRELTKDQLLERIAESGGLFWHERAPLTAPVPTGKEVIS
ncbi:MAG: SPASM domain-containing protein, partial [Gimesia chilikensis]